MAEKRKRLSNGTERPSKRVAADSFELGPIIASTPGLSLSRNILFKPYHKASSGSKKHEVFLQSSRHPQLDYTAREDGRESGSLKHYVGIYDPETKKLKVVEAKKTTVRSTLRREAVEVEQQKETAQDSIMRARNALGLEFGGAKARKAIQSITDNAISPRKNRGESESDMPTADPATAALLKFITASTASMPTKEEMQAVVDDARPRPKANLNATALHDVYPLDVLIPRSTLASLDVGDWMDTEKAVTTTSAFVSHRLVRVVREGDVSKIKALRYLLHLIQFHNSMKIKRLPARVPKREDLELHIGKSKSLINDIIKKFAVGFELPKWNLDLLVTHICALALIVDNFDVDIFDLHKDLSREPLEMQNYFREIGAKVAPPSENERAKLKITKAEAMDHRIAKLRTPLVFPQVRVRQTKRR